MGLIISNERRLLLTTTAATVVGGLLQVVAIATPHWVEVEYHQLVATNATVIVGSYAGVWMRCVVRRLEATHKEEDTCHATSMFPTEEALKENHAVDSSFLDYRRTLAAFCIITLVIMFLAHFFAFYTLRRPRYIHKRLTALLHIMAAACILVINEVFSNSVNYAVKRLPERHPLGSQHHYGFSYALSWLVFVVYLIAFIIFLICSHKKKHDMADSIDVFATEDEPVQLGRV